MPWNGSGTYTRVHNWVSDRDSSVPITASRMDAEDDAIATGLNNCLTKDGQNSPTANINWGGYKITSLSATFSARTDVASIGAIQDGAMKYAVDSGTADAYVIAPSPAITAYANGQEFTFLPGADNTGDTTLAVSGLTATQILVGDGVTLPAGTIQANRPCTVKYAASKFYLQSLPANITAAGLALLDDANAAAQLTTLGAVSGPASSTDHALARFDLTTGKVLQDSSFATLSDGGALSINGSAAALTLQKDDDGANGSFIILYQNSASPAANDLMGLIRWSGKDSAGNVTTYGQYLLSASDTTDGSEDGLWTVQTVSGGTLANRLLLGAGLYMSGASDPGAGAVGALAYYENGRRVYPAGCWGYVTVSGGTPTLRDSHNVTSITDTATGRLTVTIATDFANANYAVEQHNNTYNYYPVYASKAAGSIILENRGAAGGLDDPNSYDWAFYGDI